MGGIYLCGTHGYQAPARTSARLVAALKRKESIPADWVSLVIVKSDARTSWHIVDSERVLAVGLDPASSPLFLQDRDRASNLLHDRLLVVKLIASDLQSPVVCKLCLAAAVAPQDALRLRLPKELAEGVK